MLRILITGIFILVFFLLQITIGRSIAIASVAPNLLLILVSEFGFVRGQKTGIWVGFFSGLILDIYYGDAIGFYALLYMVIGYLNGFFHQLYYDEDITLPIGLLTGSNLLYGFFVYVIRFLLRNRLRFSYYFPHVIIAETVYTLLIAVLIYRPLLKVNRIIEKIEKRSASKFG
ncbi:MAG: rod shape-determining protein MreD [Lachnospiraceae bacterium]|nr:rod shape-determining protein MreD [Lachnospiraceae bacterium]